MVMASHVKQPNTKQTRANRRAGGRKAAEAKKRNAERRAALLADMAPGSPFVGSQPVDGEIGRTLARIRAHIEGRKR